MANEMKRSAGHLETIGDYEYFAMPDGRLFRALASTPIEGERRVGKFVTTAGGTAFALRLARLAAGTPEMRG